MIYFMEENLEPTKELNNEISDNNNRSNSEEVKDAKSEKNINLTSNTDKSQNNSNPKVDINNENAVHAKTISIHKKELPIEKKPFKEFINTIIYYYLYFRGKS